MSWVIQAAGKTEAVREAVKPQFAKITYLQGAETEIKDKVAELVDVALAGFMGATGVRLECSGSASTSGTYDEEKKVHTTTTANQSVKISIEPLWGYVE